MESGRTVQLFLIRHGLTQWNAERRYLGHSDLPVNSGSLEEYIQLKTFLHKYSTVNVYSSDLLRCRETAAFLFPHQPVTYDARLRELHFGEWEGRTYEDLKHCSMYSSWLDNWESTGPPGGETGVSFQNRVSSFLKEFLAGNPDAAVIVTHGGVIRQIVSSFLNTPEFWHISAPFGKAVAIRAEEREEGWTCISLSEEPIAGKELM